MCSRSLESETTKHISRVQGRAKKEKRKIKAGDLAGAIKILVKLSLDEGIKLPKKAPEGGR